MSRLPLVAAVCSLLPSLVLLSGGLLIGQSAPVVAAVPAPGEPDTRPAVLVGHAIQERGGTPVVGATVRCATPFFIPGCATGWSVELPCRFDLVTTDETGSFRFEFPEVTDLYWIVVMPRGDTGAADVRLPWRTDFSDTWIKRGVSDIVVTVPPSSSLAGTVLDESGCGLAGVDVHAWQAGQPYVKAGTFIPPDATVVTDALGQFEFPTTSASVVIEARAEGWTASERLYAQPMPGHRLEGLTLTMNRSRFVDGVVTDAGGVPIADVVVQAIRGSPHDPSAATGVPGVFHRTDVRTYARTDADGAFRLGPLPHDEVQIAVGQQPYLPWISELLPDGQFLRIVLDSGASLSGVVRGPDGRCIAGATLRTLAYGGFSVATNSAGEYTFMGVPPSEATVVGVQAEHCALKIVEHVRIEPGTAARLDVELEAAVRIAGRALDYDGTPLADTPVFIHGDRALETVEPMGLLWRREGLETVSWEEYLGCSDTYTDEHGAFRFDQLYPGHYRLMVQGARPEMFQVEPKDGEIELRLRPPDVPRRRLRGLVIDATTGAPIDDYDVEAIYSTRSPNNDEPLCHDGPGFVLDVSIGSVRVIVGAPAREFRIIEYDGECARDFDETFALGRGRRLVVKLVDGRGAPLAHRCVQVAHAPPGGQRRPMFTVGRKWAWGEAVTDETGSIIAEGLPAAVLQVSSSSRYSGADTRPARLISEIVDLSEPGDDRVVTLVMPDPR